MREGLSQGPSTVTARVAIEARTHNACMRSELRADRSLSIRLPYNMTREAKEHNN